MLLDNKAHVRLLTNPYAQTTIQGASLPPAYIDPNLRLTEALHILWQQVRAFIHLGEEYSSYRPPVDEPNLSVADALLHLQDAIVRFD